MVNGQRKSHFIATSRLAFLVSPIVIIAIIALVAAPTRLFADYYDYISHVPKLPANGDINVAAEGAVVIDAYTGKFIYEKNADMRLYPASTTKILTALLVIESGDLDKLVTIQRADTHAEPSIIGFKPGEQYTRKQLLYALLMKSANDAALALARDNAGSIAAFAEKMNRRAKELGAEHSHFTNPNGLPDRNHYTTPHDLALITRAAMHQPFFHQVVSTLHHDWVSPRGTINLRNHNRMLDRFPGCDGIKTGYTFAAQQVLASSAVWGNREVISVIMHSTHPRIWRDSMLLLTYGFAHLPAEKQPASLITIDKQK